jgi:NAD(P)H-hydrate repair Nnr-like enzyme with NAD(P)H-hydrate dehydratase domain
MLTVKGPSDIITDGTEAWVVAAQGCIKRPGGIGDVLAGTMATALHKARVSGQPLIYGAIAASLITRAAARSACFEHGLSLTAPDIIRCLSRGIKEFASL